MKHRLTKPEPVTKITAGKPSKLKITAGAVLTAAGACALQTATDTTTIVAGYGAVTLGTLYIALNASGWRASHNSQGRIGRQAKSDRPRG